MTFFETKPSEFVPTSSKMYAINGTRAEEFCRRLASPRTLSGGCLGCHCTSVERRACRVGPSPGVYDLARLRGPLRDYCAAKLRTPRLASRGKASLSFSARTGYAASVINSATGVKRIPRCLKSSDIWEIRKRQRKLREMYRRVRDGECAKCVRPPLDKLACLSEVFGLDAQVHVSKLQTTKREWSYILGELAKGKSGSE
ncbi:hypothetical protein BDZ89DRAFT_1111984 [Hymenopellis radicata]|nr:hypothetical protein BDZ89DRAFT_1111984 [Hymenopellis radicata]